MSQFNTTCAWFLKVVSAFLNILLDQKASISKLESCTARRWRHKYGNLSSYEAVMRDSSGHGRRVLLISLASSTGLLLHQLHHHGSDFYKVGILLLHEVVRGGDWRLTWPCSASPGTSGIIHDAALPFNSEGKDQDRRLYPHVLLSVHLFVYLSRSFRPNLPCSFMMAAVDAVVPT